PPALPPPAAAGGRRAARGRATAWPAGPTCFSPSSTGPRSCSDAAVAGRAAQPAGAGFARPVGPASTTDVGADWCRGAGDTCAQCRLGGGCPGAGLGAVGAAGGGARPAYLFFAQAGS